MNLNESLPKSSSQETLETISKNKLAAILNPSLFELRFENQRDKGVDLTVELKQNDFYTNFRFAVQLKSTASSKCNKDGTLSFSVDISNLNYLLNFGMPAYYILYDHNADKFYIESINEVYRNILLKYPPDQFPKTFAINFSQLLTNEQIDEVYRHTFENGTILKKLHPHIYFSSKQSDGIKGILIDMDKDVYSVDQNIAFIEHHGFNLINEREFGRIIEIEQRTHPRTKASPIFNMVCGLAYYQLANLFKSVELLKLAEAERQNLPEGSLSLLQYFLLHARYLLGMIDRDTFRKDISKVVADENAGTYIKLEDIYHRFMTKEGGTPQQMVTRFYNNISKLLDDDPDNYAMRIAAYAKLLSSEGDLLLHELAANCTHTLGRRKDPYRDLLNQDWHDLNSQYITQYKALTVFAFRQYDFLAINNLMMDQIEWDYEKGFHFHAIENFDSITHSVKGEISSNTRKRMEKNLTTLVKMEEAYQTLKHVENLYSCLQVKYQIQDFIGEKEQAEATARTMYELINTYELNALKAGYYKLMEGKTKHYLFIQRLNEKMRHIYKIAKNANIAQYMYEDLDEEKNALIKRRPEWSFKTLLPLTIPEISDEHGLFTEPI